MNYLARRVLALKQRVKPRPVTHDINDPYAVPPFTGDPFAPYRQRRARP